MKMGERSFPASYGSFAEDDLQNPLAHGLPSDQHGGNLQLGRNNESYNDLARTQSHCTLVQGNAPMSQSQPPSCRRRNVASSENRELYRPALRPAWPEIDHANARSSMPTRSYFPRYMNRNQSSVYEDTYRAEGSTLAKHYEVLKHFIDMGYSEHVIERFIEECKRPNGTVDELLRDVTWKLERLKQAKPQIYNWTSAVYSNPSAERNIVNQRLDNVPWHVHAEQFPDVQGPNFGYFYGSLPRGGESSLNNWIRRPTRFPLGNATTSLGEQRLQTPRSIANLQIGALAGDCITPTTNSGANASYTSARDLIIRSMKREEELRQKEEQRLNEACALSTIPSSGAYVGTRNMEADDIPEDADLYGSSEELSYVQEGAARFSFEETSESTQQPLERIEQERMCKICSRNVANMLFLRCSHMVCCDGCTQAIQHCPICKKRVEKSCMY